MARDDAARDSGSEKSLLDRRSYLKMAGVAAATAAAVNAVDSAKAASGTARTDAPVREATEDGRPPEKPHELIIDGSDHPNAPTTYRFEVSGDIRGSDDLDSVDTARTARGCEVSGRVAGDELSFPFSGRITGFRLDGPADVRVEDGS